MEVFLGPPSTKTNLALWAGDRLKDWWWFLAAGVPVLHPPLTSAPLTARSTHHDRDGLLLEKLKLSRGTTPWVFAEAHARGWAQTVRDAQSQPMIAAGTVAASFEHELRAARARLTLWAAADASILSRLTGDSVAVDRCILVPVYVEDDIMALVPDVGFFGVACTKGQLAVQSARLAREAGVSAATNLVNVSMNSLEGRDYVFSAVAKAPPSAAGLSRLGDVEWRTLGNLHGVKSFAYASLAMRRELQLRQASGGAPLVIGALGEAEPLVPNSMGSAWSSAPDDAAAPAEWLLFLERDAQAAARLAAAMTKLDAGDGRLANWALNVKSTRDVAHEIPIPPQGRVRLDPRLRWLLLPEYFVPYPLPYTSQMLVRLPAQQVPPGFVPRHVSEAMEAWAIRRVHMHCVTERQRAVWFWQNMPDQSVAALTSEQEREWLRGAPRGPGWLHLGAGAFKRIPHIDGVGYWVANAIVQQADAQGGLTVFDWTVGFRSEFSTEDMMRMFDVRTDLELLSQLFDGSRYKAAPDRGLTLAPNLDSYASRAVQIAKELGSLAKSGRYVVRPLYYLEDGQDTGAWPTFFIPQTSISVGGVDQPYKPLKKRRVADASGAHVEVLARHRDEGAPDGEPYVSLNERYGPMRPPAGKQVCQEPHQLTPFGSLCDCCRVVLVRHSADGAHMWWGMLFCWRCLEGKLWLALEPLKWHKEGKHRVHHIYRACAYLSAAADIVDEDLTVLEDDWKTQFWQFRVHPIELPTSTLYSWVELYDSQIAWCHVAAYVNDMGKSPSSNITSSTSIHHVDVWKRNMVAIAAPVIATMGSDMNDLLDVRRERYGETQAVLWAGFAFHR